MKFIWFKSERLFKLLRDKNNRHTLTGINFTFNVSNQVIEITPEHHNYSGRQEVIDLFPRLAEKYIGGKAFESHLQEYIVQNIGRNINISLDTCLLGTLKLDWLGNEVSCGVGMQRIDILLDTLKDATTKIIIPIELKACEAETNNVFQIQRYVDWLEQYYLPNRVGDIQPVLVALPPTSKASSTYNQTIQSLKKFNIDNPRCLPLKYIEYQIEEGNILFQTVVY